MRGQGWGRRRKGMWKGGNKKCKSKNFKVKNKFLFEGTYQIHAKLIFSCAYCPEFKMSVVFFI